MWKYSGNSTNLAKHLRLSHKSVYDDVMKRRSEEEVQGEKTQGARARQTLISESFGSRGRSYPGTER